MWYFVEKNGRAIKKQKNLLAVQLEFLNLVESGEDPDSLKITDAAGHEYRGFGKYDPNWNK